MRIIKSYLIIGFLALVTSSYAQKVYTENDIRIIPKPTQTLIKTGVFEFNKDTKFVTSNDFQKEAANALASKFAIAAGWKPETVVKAPTSNFVQFKVDPNIKSEAYILDVNPNSIVISAKGNTGFLYGLESVRQLLPETIESQYAITSAKWQIPSLTITDEPRFKWRGLMLDLSRHFFDKNYIRHDNTIESIHILLLE